MAKNLDFERLAPERDTFTDGDGSTYEFRGRMDFGAEDAAIATALEKRLDFARKRMHKNPADTDAQRKFDAASRDFLALILPDLPEKRREELALGQVNAIVEWWGNRQPSMVDPGED